MKNYIFANELQELIDKVNKQEYTTSKATEVINEMVALRIVNVDELSVKELIKYAKRVLEDRDYLYRSGIYSSVMISTQNEKNYLETTDDLDSLTAQFEIKSLREHLKYLQKID